MALDEGTDSYRWFRLGFSCSAAGVYSFRGCLRPADHVGGAQILTYKDLLSTIARHLNRKRLMLPIPFVIWELLAALASVLPNPPLTRDQIELMRHDNIVDLDSAGFVELGIEPRGIKDLLSICLG